MCLAVPGKIIELHDDAQATIDMMGTRRDISIRLTPDAQPGDYVLVHAGFAIQAIDAEEAARSEELFRELEELEADELAATGAA